jgi:hypothetical protein
VCRCCVCVQVLNGSTHNGTSEPKQIPWPIPADLYARRHCSRSLLSLLSVYMCLRLIVCRLCGVRLWAAPRLLGLVVPRPRFLSERFCTPNARVFVCRVRFLFCGNDVYCIHNHIICMITRPPCALATCWLRTCRSSPDFCALAVWQDQHHVRCCRFINGNHVATHTFTQC